MTFARTHHRRTIPALLCAFLLIASTTSISAIPPTDDPGPSTDRITLVSSSAQEVTLDVRVNHFEPTEVHIDNVTYQRIRVNEAGTTQEVGQPEVPVIGQYVAIPLGAKVHAEIVEADRSVLPGYWVFPAQQPPTDQGTEPPPFEIDRAAYAQDDLYPQQQVTWSDPQTIRDLTVIRLAVHPLQFNPARRELHFTQHLRIRLTFSGGNVSTYMQSQTDDAFHGLCQRFELNCDTAEQHLQSPPIHTTSTNGAEYLIVSAPQYANAANALAAWKTKRGIRTVVRTTDDVGGSNASAIKDYIQTAYHTWSPRPAYVLLLGDADAIPVHYVTEHPASLYPDGHLTGTDLYYATMGGSGDVLPDMHLGRIPVDSPEEADHVVAKIIAYEADPPSDDAFYQQMAMGAVFQDEDNDRYADRLFVRTTEQIRDYLKTDYDVQRIYYAESWIDPGWYYDGTPIPNELLRSSGFRWDGDETDIIDAVNDGVLILHHRDHGSSAGWAHPLFNLNHINALSNGAEMPVVFSINCATGWFDAETDGFASSDYDPGFGEKLLRHGNGGEDGAVGVFAATRVSYSWHNDVLIKGMYDSIWPGYLSYSGALPSPRLGDTLTYAKYYYDTQYGHSSTRSLTTLEIFHYLGDPTMEIWTAPPANMSISHEANARDQDRILTVHGAPSGALVSVVQDGTILGTAQSTDGTATVVLDPTFRRGTADVTVTKHNYRPYQGTVDVIPLLPFYDGFESGTLRTGWSSSVTDEGRVEVATGGAHAGSYSVHLDDTTDNEVHSQAGIVLTIDLSEVSNVGLGFWYRSFTDTPHAEDGVFFSDDGGGSWALIENLTTTAGYEHTAIDVDQETISNGLTLSDAFQIKFQFYGNGSTPDAGYAIDDISIDTDPATPTNLKVRPVSCTQLDLSWADNSGNEVGFEVERSADSLSDWTPVATLAGNATSFSDVALARGTPYFYRVRAFREDDRSAYSNVGYARTPAWMTYLPLVIRQ